MSVCESATYKEIAYRQDGTQLLQLDRTIVGLMMKSILQVEFTRESHQDLVQSKTETTLSRDLFFALP